MGTPVKTKLFLSNRTQAVRLPKGVAFPPEVTEVELIREGSRVVIVPAGRRWNDFFDRPGLEDFPDRDQPGWQERETL
jgi:antitoxin VapB